MVVPLGSLNDSTLGRPGTESLRSSAPTPCFCNSRLMSVKSAFGATSNDSLLQRDRVPCCKLDGELAGLGREEGAFALAAGKRQPDHLGVMLDRLVEVWRLEGGVTDPQHFDHELISPYLRPTRSISADMPPCPAPSWISRRILDLDRGEIRKRVLQQFAGVKVLRLRRPAGLVFELFWL